MQAYIKYVEDTIKKFSQTMRLIENDQVTPQALNSALAYYLDTNLALIAEYQRSKYNLYVTEQEFEKWYDEQFIEVKTDLYSRIEGKTKPALKEIEIEIKSRNKDVYYELKKGVKEKEMEVSFLRRLAESYKKFDMILTTLAKLMTQEMFTLSIESRMNADPTKNKVRRVVKEE